MSFEIKYLDAVGNTFHSHKRLAERAIEQVSDEQVHVSLDANTNSIAVISKHIGGNLKSRWSDFLTTDGEKPWRNRDDEFIDTFVNRAEMMEHWQCGWDCLFQALKGFDPTDLVQTVFIRGEEHSVALAIERSLGHTCYHVGQIVQVARIHAGDQWRTLTIPPGGSVEYNQKNWGSRS